MTLPESVDIVPKSAKPFLKWVGGKNQLLAQFETYFPSNFERYFEPFVGGGAVFFRLWNSGKLPAQVFLFDNNDELINTYLAIRDDPDTLIDRLRIHKKRHSKEYYYTIRGLDRQDLELTDVERAARTIYLYKTCYNGLYRVNRKGQFNVPMGSYKNPQILHEGVLKHASLALQNVSIEVKDFRQIVDIARPGDFFYFDPPYDPVSKTARFTNYTPGSFGDDDQRDLATVYTQLTRKGGENENWTMGRRFLRFFLNVVAKPILVAKHLEWEVLKKSNLDWTLVRPPRISKGKSTGNLLADEKNLARTQVNVEDLANFILAQITSEKWVKKAPLVASVK